MCNTMNIAIFCIMFVVDKKLIDVKVMKINFLENVVLLLFLTLSLCLLLTPSTCFWRECTRWAVFIQKLDQIRQQQSDDKSHVFAVVVNILIPEKWEKVIFDFIEISWINLFFQLKLGFKVTWTAKIRYQQVFYFFIWNCWHKLI